LAIDIQAPVNPQVRKLEEGEGGGDDRYGRFDIEPLEPGFGTTLGNTLRRVLLSSLWGAAVTSIQIEGVAHEFTSIPHVKEDVTELILNLKQLNLKSFTEDPVTLMLDVKGPAEVHASDIQTTSDVEIVNPDLYICTIAAKGHLRMELNVERGKGYVPAERNKREGQPIGVVTTDGTVTPEEAVSTAAQLFTQHLDLFVRFGDSIVTAQPGAPAKGPGNRLNETPIEELDLSVRAFNCLKANDITSVGQLLTKKEEELLGLRNFGRKSLDEIKEKLVEKGFVQPEDMETVFR
jgi:DNA-directed RNA polymerase subunit alpha